MVETDSTSEEEEESSESESYCSDDSTTDDSDDSDDSDSEKETGRQLESVGYSNNQVPNVKWREAKAAELNARVQKATEDDDDNDDDDDDGGSGITAAARAAARAVGTRAVRAARAAKNRLQGRGDKSTGTGTDPPPSPTHTFELDNNDEESIRTLILSKGLKVGDSSAFKITKGLGSTKNISISTDGVNQAFGNLATELSRVTRKGGSNEVFINQLDVGDEGIISIIEDARGKITYLLQKTGKMYTMQKGTEKQELVALQQQVIEELLSNASDDYKEPFEGVNIGNLLWAQIYLDQIAGIGVYNPGGDAYNGGFFASDDDIKNEREAYKKALKTMYYSFSFLSGQKAADGEALTNDWEGEKWKKYVDQVKLREETQTILTTLKDFAKKDAGKANLEVNIDDVINKSMPNTPGYIGEWGPKNFPYLSEANKITGFFMTSASEDYQTAAYKLFDQFQKLRLHVVNKIGSSSRMYAAQVLPKPTYSRQVARSLDPFASQLYEISCGVSNMYI